MQISENEDWVSKYLADTCACRSKTQSDRSQTSVFLSLQFFSI